MDKTRIKKIRTLTEEEIYVGDVTGDPLKLTNARSYREHEDNCIYCREARYRLSPSRHRCDAGQALWLKVNL